MVDVGLEHQNQYRRGRRDAAGSMDATEEPNCTAGHLVRIDIPGEPDLGGQAAWFAGDCPDTDQDFEPVPMPMWQYDWYYTKSLVSVGVGGSLAVVRPPPLTNARAHLTRTPSPGR